MTIAAAIREALDTIERMIIKHDGIMFDVFQEQVYKARAALALLDRGEAEREETAWLIEKPQDGDRPAKWWCGSGCYGPWSTPDSAVRFCRKEDAERVIRRLNLVRAIATEHGWYPQAASPPVPKPDAGERTCPRCRSVLRDGETCCDDWALPAPAAPEQGCTGIAAHWCPVHGECSCAYNEALERTLDDETCPLHGSESPHGNAAPPPREPGEAEALTKRAALRAFTRWYFYALDMDGPSREHSTQFMERFDAELRAALQRGGAR